MTMRESLIVLGTLILALGIIESYWLVGPLDRDQSLYLVVSHLMLKGARLYTDVWDHKPPLIHIAYAAAQLVAGYSTNAVLLLAVFLNSVTGFGIYYLTKKFSQSSAAASFALTLWIILAESPNLEAATPNTEAFINACWVAATVVLSGSSRFIIRVVVAGVLIAMATLFKQIVIILFFPLVIFVVARAINRRTALMGMLAALVLFPVLAWSGAYGYFSFQDRANDFYQAVIHYNRVYAGNLFQNIRNIFSVRALFPIHALALFLPWQIISVTIVRMLIGRGDRTLAGYLIFLFASIYLVIALPGRHYTHYYQYLIPPSCVLLGIFSAGIWRRWFCAMVIVVIGFALLWELPLALIPGLMRRSPMNPESLKMAARNTLPAVQRVVPEGGWFYLWGAEPGMYFESRIDPRQGVLHVNWLTEGPVAARLTQQTLSVLERDPPAAVVVVRPFVRPDNNNNPVFRWIMEHYREPKGVNSSDKMVVMTPR